MDTWRTNMLFHITIRHRTSHNGISHPAVCDCLTLSNYLCCGFADRLEQRQFPGRKARGRYTLCQALGAVFEVPRKLATTQPRASAAPLSLDAHRPDVGEEGWQPLVGPAGICSCLAALCQHQPNDLFEHCAHRAALAFGQPAVHAAGSTMAEPLLPTSASAATAATGARSDASAGERR